MVRVSSPAKLRPWFELTAKLVMGVVPGGFSERLSEGVPRRGLPEGTQKAEARRFVEHDPVGVRPIDFPSAFTESRSESSVSSSQHMIFVPKRISGESHRPTYEKYRDTPPISIAILLQKHALLLAKSSIYTTNLYHDTAPICIAILLQKC